MSDGGRQTGRAHAESLDLADPLAGCREQFAIPARPDGSPAVYLCGNSLGLMPNTAGAAVHRVLEDWASYGVDAHFKGPTPWFSYHEMFRATGARLVGAKPGEVVMMNSLTVNLHLMMTTFYRPEGRRTKILIEDSTFPSDRYAVASQAQVHGLDPATAVMVARPREGEHLIRIEDIEGMLEEHGAEIALVMLSGINYYTGQWFDIERITAAARRQGCRVGFDLAHGAGNVPHALHDWDVDFAVWCSYKYLNAGPGAVGGCFVHERHARDPELPRLAGWWGTDPSTRFEMHRSIEFVPQDGAEGWQVSNPPILAMAPLEASLRIFDDVGMEAVRAKSVALTAYLEQLLDGVGTDRFEILTPRNREERGSQLSIRVRDDARVLFEKLSRRGIVVDFRQPDVVRVALVPLYNTYLDAWKFAREFGEVVGVPLVPSDAAVK